MDDPRTGDNESGGRESTGQGSTTGPVQSGVAGEGEQGGSTGNIFHFPGSAKAIPGGDSRSSDKDSSLPSVEAVLQRARELKLDHCVIIGEHNGASVLLGNDELDLRTMAWLLLIFQNTMQSLMNGSLGMEG